MAMPMVLMKDLEFSIPIVGPKVYIVKGPSGWPETFKRDALDKELAAFVRPIAVDDLVSMFIASRELSEEGRNAHGVRIATDWHTITGFIARTMSISPLTVPHTVAIAFWGLVVIATTELGSN